MSLCSLCQSIPFDKLPVHQGGYSHSRPGNLTQNPCLSYSHAYREPIGFPYHDSLDSLKEAAAACPLCYLINGEIGDWLKRWNAAYKSNSSFRVRVDDGIYYNLSRKEPLWLTKRKDGQAGFLVLVHPPDDRRRRYLIAAVGFCVDADNPLAPRFPLRIPSIDSGSTVTSELAARWVRRCRESHAECSDNEPPLPSRIIEVGTLEESEVKLIEAKGALGRYASLSYCWGTLDNFVTTRANLSDRLKKIRVEDLPKTLCDAIDISRRVGLHFIWIDSICICQDDREDWARESAQMAEVYSNATLVIAAQHAANSQTGCFGSRLKRRTTTFYLPGVESVGAKVTAIALNAGKEVEHNHWDLRWEDQSLSTRAWAMQERLLATRTLHYCSDQMYFECSHGIIGEDGYGSKSRFLDLSTADNKQSGSSLHSPAHKIWNSIVWEYGGRDLTRPTDKLVAISGVARKLRPHFKADYIAGFWSDALVQSLSWRPLGRERAYSSGKTASYVAPSWSWASYNGMPGLSFEEGWIDVARVNDHYCELETFDPFGQLNSAWLDLTAPIVPVALCKDSDEYMDLGKKAGMSSIYVQIKSMDVNDQSCRADFDHFDVSDRSMLESLELFALVLGFYSIPSITSSIAPLCLIVTPTESSDEFRRLGTWKMPENLWEICRNDPVYRKNIILI